jgi:hypothetical protein
MSTIQKINGKPVLLRTRRGVRVFRVVRKSSGGVSIDRRFRMRVFRGGRRVYFTLPSSCAAAIAEADRIHAFLEVRGNSLDDAVREFGAG